MESTNQIRPAANLWGVEFAGRTMRSRGWKGIPFFRLKIDLRVVKSGHVKIVHLTRPQLAAFWLYIAIGRRASGSKLLMDHPAKAIATIAAEHGRCGTRLAKLVGLSCLAPDIVITIVEGRQPATLNAKLLTSTNIPLAWRERRAVLGF